MCTYIRKSFFYWISLLLIFVVLSCGTKASSKKAQSSYVYENGYLDRNCIDVPTERPIFHASNTILTDLIHTKLEITPDWEKQYLYGVATITAKPHFFPSDSLILDAKRMQIHSVLLNDKMLSYTYKNDKLSIRLDRRYTRNEYYTVTIKYTAKPNAPKELERGDARGLYFINPLGEIPSQMPQIWTQGETESSSVWFPTIDSPNAKTSQEIFITVEDKYRTLSNGVFVSGVQNIDGTRTDHWKQEQIHAPYLFMIAVGEFKIVKDSYTKKDGSTIDVHYYVEPQWEQYARTIFGETPNMLRYFSELLGVEYPWDKYHQIVVREYVSGAMENTGAVVFGDFVYRTDRESIDENSDAIIAHELFHHWFGDLVTCESWSNLALNEAFANYAQYLWDEYKYGKDQADLNADEQAQRYIQQGKMQGYHNLIWYDYDEKNQMFDTHSYNKGGRILHMLRNYLGDDAFFASLQKYLLDNQYKAAEFHHLRLAFEEITGEDLNWFFDQWFSAAGHPELNITHQIVENKFVLKIEQTQNLVQSPIFRLPTQIALVDSLGMHVHDIVIDKLEQEFIFPIRGNLQTFIFDNQATMLAETNEDKTQQQFIRQYYNSNKWYHRYRALKLGTVDITEKSQQLILDALKDPFWQIRSVAIEKSIRLKDNYRQKAIQIITQQLLSDPNSSVRTDALAFIELANLLNKDKYYEKALNDSSYLVVSTALKFLGKISPDKAMQQSKELENEPSQKIIVGIGGLYAEHGDHTKFEFFKKHLTSGQMTGFDELGLMNIFSQYLTKHSIEAVEAALPIYSYLQQRGSRYTKIFFSQNINFIIDNLNDRLDKSPKETEQLSKLIERYKQLI